LLSASPAAPFFLTRGADAGASVMSTSAMLKDGLLMLGMGVRNGSESENTASSWAGMRGKQVVAP
jgi:hypothetical protein